MSAGQGSAGNVIAALCSLFIPGLGQLIQGRFIWALFWVVFGTILWVVSFTLLGWVAHLLSCLHAAWYSPKRSYA